ncbi:MAG: hypothetical protein FWB71_04375 [Defluviitaleaceae bacterium]|nr:hypothetical protein [Defluviitaleaceae bacterium]
MMNFEKRGNDLRDKAKSIVLEFMASAQNKKFTQTEIFRECGFDWSDYQNAKSTQQQYWVVALLRELESENKITRDENKKWGLV